MNLSWDRLRVLDAVARTGSVTRAASMLHLTGPAVSQQLRRIEAETGVTVVAADGRGIRLTPHGMTLAGHARRVADVMQQAENDLQEGAPYVGHLRVAAIASAVRAVLAPRLPAFQSAHPGIRVTLEDGETVDHLERLTDGTVGLVLAESWSTSPLRIPTHVTSRRIAREPLLLTLTAGHPLSGRPRVSMTELAAERWATCASGSDAHTALVQAARRAGVEPDVGHFVADHHTQLELVRHGLAVACLPPLRERTVVQVPLEDDLHRDVLLLLARRTPSSALRVLVEHLTA